MSSTSSSECEEMDVESIYNNELNRTKINSKNFREKKKQITKTLKENIKIVDSSPLEDGVYVEHIYNDSCLNIEPRRMIIKPLDSSSSSGRSSESSTLFIKTL